MNTRAEDIYNRLAEMNDSQSSHKEISRIIENILDLAKKRGYSREGLFCALEFMLAIAVSPLGKGKRRDVLRDLEDLSKFLRWRI